MQQTHRQKTLEHCPKHGVVYVMTCEHCLAIVEPEREGEQVSLLGQDLETSPGLEKADWPKPAVSMTIEPNKKGEERLNELAYAAKKAASGKPDLSLLAPDFLRGMAYVLAYGNDKHGRFNWQEGLNWSDVIAAVKRHIAEWEEGIEGDEDTDQNPLFHAATGLMYLTWFEKNGVGNDDRPYKKVK